MKTYIAKQNLPGGIIKGDKIENLINKRTGLKIPYDPSTETNFFDVEKPMLFKINELCVINTNAKIIPCTRDGNKLRSKQYTLFQNNKAYKIIGYNDNKYIIQNDSNLYALFYENDIRKYDTYYFVNSKGTICKTITGVDKKADDFRKSIGNYHESHSSCSRYIMKLSNIKNENGD